jgi:predicted ArsR family transcriptional regulator
MDLGRNASGIGSLAEPTRRRLYDYVVAQPGPVGREQTARELDLALHTVSFHLDRLVEEGLLDVEYRRLTERSGPGSGRPSKLYRRSEREIAVSLPPRRYDLVGDILAAAVTRALAGTELAGSLSDAAREAGAEVGRQAADEAEGDSMKRLAAALEPLGYEPRPGDDDDGGEGAMLLANCPYHSLAQDHTQLVCGLNQHFVQGVADGVGCEGVRACLEPRDGRCCVVARPDRDQRGGAVR